jgi:predicted lysophospholipase L1 biosynthesis ABC-type transport system permease subunit
MREQTPESRPMRTMDWLVVALIVCAGVLPLLLASASTDVRRTIQTAATAFAAVVTGQIKTSHLWALQNQPV